MHGMMFFLAEASRQLQLVKGDVMKRQKHYWTVEIEGLDWTKARKIWNFESAKAVYEQEKRFAKAQGKRIDMFYTSPNGTKGMVIDYSNSK